MKKHFLLSTTLLCSLFVLFSVVVQPVSAQMVDEENSVGNQWGTGSLDVSQTIETTDISIFSTTESSNIVQVKREGSLGFQYQSAYHFEAGDEPFCQIIHLQIKTEDETTTLYDGPLSSLNGSSQPRQLIPDSLSETLKYFYSIDTQQTAPTTQTSCQFLLNTQAWQFDQSDSSSGYSDYEETQVTLTFHPEEQDEEPPAPVGKVVINEVFEDGANALEWVELYNNNTQPISLNQWSIKDKTDLSIDVLPDVSISGKSFAVIVTSGADSSLITQLDASGTLVIQLNNATIGNGLNTAGDELYLKNNLNEIVDSLSWGSEHDIFTMPNLADGDSYSRVSVGVDIDSESDWERLQTPTPGN